MFLNRILDINSESQPVGQISCRLDIAQHPRQPWMEEPYGRLKAKCRQIAMFQETFWSPVPRAVVRHREFRSMTMISSLRSAAILCLLSLAMLAQGSDAARAQDAHGTELVVGTKEAPPFAIKQHDGSWSGISIELWRRIADKAGLRFRLVEARSVQDLVDGVASGTFNVGVAAVTVTAAREHRVEFTQPFYHTGLGVAVPINESPWVSIGRALLSFSFLKAVAVLLALSLLVGFLIWLLEHRKTEHFGGGAKGLGSSFWWSTIAMTQAGAAHNAPATLPGRIIATGWMIASVIAIAVFTAGITSTLTRKELQGAVHNFNDLRSVRVGAVAPSATSDYLNREQLPFRAFPDVQAGLSALSHGEIDAFVHDKPLLAWMVRRDFSSSIRIVDTSFSSESYAIVLPKTSSLRPMLDAAVLDQAESDWWQQK